MDNKTSDLERLVELCLNDEQFVKDLEQDPEEALRRNGLPHDETLIDEIRKVDFEAFRRSLGRPKTYLC